MFGRHQNIFILGFLSFLFFEEVSSVAAACLCEFSTLQTWLNKARSVPHARWSQALASQRSSFHLGGLLQTETCGRQEALAAHSDCRAGSGAKSSTRLLGSGSASRTDKTLVPSLVPTEPDRAPDEFRSQAHTRLLGTVLCRAKSWTR